MKYIKDRRCLSLVPLLLFALLLTCPTMAQNAPVSEPKRSSAQEIYQDGIKARISDLEAVEGPSPETRAVLDLYRAALARLMSARSNDELSARYKQTVDGSAKQQAQLEAQLKQQRTAAKKPQKTPLALSLDELKQQLDKAVAGNSLDQTRLSELESELRKERLRPDQTSAELRETKQKQAEADRKQPGVDGGKTDIVTAQRVAWRANNLALASRIKRLELERLSHTPRLSLLKLRIELARGQLQQSGRSMELLQQRLNRSLAEEARKVRQATEKARLAALGKHPIVRKEAEYNSQLSAQLGELTKQIERLVAQKGTVLHQLKRIRQSRERAQQQVDVVGLDEPLGELLLAQKRTLPGVRQLDLRAQGYLRQISLVRVQRFQLTDELQQLSEDKGVVDMVAALQPADLEAPELPAYKQAMQGLIQNRVQLLSKLSEEYDRHENVLGDLALQQQQLSNEVTGYQEFLSKNLVWIPSAPQLGLADLVKIGAAMSWLLSGENWGSVAEKLRHTAQEFPVRVGVLLLSVIALTVLRRRMLGYMESVLPKIGKVNHDRYRFSLAVLAFTLLLALPPPLVLGGTGWLLYKNESSSFAWAVGTSALTVAILYLVLRFGRCLVMPNGLARTHLRWDPHAVTVYARVLPWLTPLFVLVAFIVGITEWERDVGYWNSLGRVVGILATLLMLWFAHISLNPWHGALSRSRHALLQGLRLKVLWYPLALVLGCVLLLLTFQGYNYTATVLKRLLFASFCIGVVILLLHSFARRWLLVAQRRLALKRAQARREAASEAKAAKEAADAAGEGVPEAEELEAINLASISEQTQRLLRMFAVVAFFGAMFVLWSRLTPALGGLNDIILWQYQATAGADAALASVSLWDLLLSVMVAILMLVAVRNLPGLLEIAILQPLALEPGNRFAVTSISRYLIFATGFFVALSLLGISWGDVQWLVAAMGVGLGFGLKEIFANFISGLIILFERPIRIGDTVTVGDLSGTVTRIRIRATTVTDWDNKEQVIPNQNFLINPLINWTLSDPITRVAFNVGIAYGSDTERALQVMTEVVHAQAEVLEEPRPTVFFVGFGDSSLDFEVRVFVRERLRRIPLRHDLHMALNRALAEAGIEIPFPQRDLHLRSIAPGLGLPGKESE